MKKLILGVFTLSMLLFTSCGGTIKLDQPDTVETLKTKVLENLKEGAFVTAIDIFPIHNTITTEISSVVIYYKTAEGEERSTHVYIDQMLDPLDKEGSSVRSRKEIGRAINDYDFSIIYSNVGKAAQQVIDAGAKYSGVGTYSITFNSDPTKDKHSFSILSSAGSSVQGRNLVTEYYEHEAEADAEGNVTVEVVTEE